MKTRLLAIRSNLKPTTKLIKPGTLHSPVNTHFGIIAAGQGSRLISEGSPVSKPLIEIGGQPMIERLIDIFCVHKPESIRIIVNSRDKTVRHLLESKKLKCSCPIEVIVKDTPSSMHSLWEIAKSLPATANLVATTVDTVFSRTKFADYLSKWFALNSKDHEIDALMGITDYIDDEKPLYVSVADNNRIIKFLDDPEPNIKFVSAGIYGFTSACFKVLQHCIEKGEKRLRNFQRALVDNGLRVEAFNMGSVVDVDHLSDIAKATDIVNWL